ncbi:sigma-70 family RNA polymerase sigma factor [Caloramator sp. E03]|uniref:sigma-70 family RNA polymerase sigma factor n=1 Tax=Caloramator sp. E03 TaxID=2576307 RepID=UPI0011100279|nr:sigma-70 family RNA polymerase sigma factor [Caloramator sp. E03]QCX34382.1 sigma-70 family RNA polymerase sigma factor [Caloramator sp. E03]
MREKVILARHDENVRLEILKSFEPLIKKCIKLYVKNREYYEDAFQEGYMIVLGCIYKYDLNKNYPFEGYVKSSVVYGIRDFSFNIKQHVSLDERIGEDQEGSLYDILEGDADVEEDFERKEDIKRLKEALKKLPYRQREIIEEVYFKNMSMADICKYRRCHYMSIVKMKERALKNLKENMKS